MLLRQRHDQGLGLANVASDRSERAERCRPSLGIFVDTQNAKGPDLCVRISCVHIPIPNSFCGAIPTWVLRGGCGRPWLGIAVFLRARNADYWPSSPNR